MNFLMFISIASFITYIIGFSINKSLASLAAVRWAPERDVININTDNYKFKSKAIQVNEFMGFTYDIRTSKFWAINKADMGKQKLQELCGDSKKMIASPLSKNNYRETSKSDNILLVCLTAGISGVLSIDMVSFQYGELNTKTGVWKPIGTLPATSDPGSFIDAFVFAQDNNGTLHYINGDENYFMKKRKDNDFKQVRGVTFPIVEVYLGCGDFIDDDTMVGVGSEGNLFEYSISKATAKSKTVKSGTGLMDVTNGPLSTVCPARTLTAVTNSDDKSVIVSADSSSFRTVANYEVGKIVGITKDLSTGYMYAITNSFSIRQEQILKKLCKSSDEIVVRISPPGVELSCLTSGQRGVFAIDMQGKQFGKLDIKTGKFESIGDIKGPYNAYAFAQGYDGVLHHINGDGKHYDTSKNKNKLMPSGVKFPSNNLGICGEFDASDIISVSAGKNGGIVRYSFIKSTTYAETEKSERIFADITTGSITDITCSQIKTNAPIENTNSPTKKFEKKMDDEKKDNLNSKSAKSKSKSNKKMAIKGKKTAKKAKRILS